MGGVVGVDPALVRRVLLERGEELAAEERRYLAARRSIAAWLPLMPPGDHGPIVPHGWQVDAARVLQESIELAADPRHRRWRVLLIDAPTRAGKTQLVRAAMSWAMAQHGLSCAWVCADVEGLARPHSERTRVAMQAAQTQAIWPHLLAQRGDIPQIATRWGVPREDPELPPAMMYATGRTGGIEGQHVPVVCFDDVFKNRDEASSLAEIRRVRTLMIDAAVSRVRDIGGLIVDMGTRRGPSDTKAMWEQHRKRMAAEGVVLDIVRLSYPLRGPEGWRYPGGYLTPGYVELEEVGSAPDDPRADEVRAWLLTGRASDAPPEGVTLPWAAGPWMSAKERTERSSLEGWAVVALDGGEPVDVGGLFERARHLGHTYSAVPSQLARTASATYLTCDAAETEGGGDRTVIQWWAVVSLAADGETESRPRLALLHQWRGQWASEQVVQRLREAIAYVRSHRAPLSGVLVEETSAGKHAIPSLRREGLPVVPVKAVGSKAARIRGTLTSWAVGLVLLPSIECGDEAQWCYERDEHGHDWRDRMCRLRADREDMRGEVDDEADAATVMLRHFLDAPAAPALPSREVRDRLLARLRR